MRGAKTVGAISRLTANGTARGWVDTTGTEPAGPASSPTVSPAKPSSKSPKSSFPPPSSKSSKSSAIAAECPTFVSSMASNSPVCSCRPSSDCLREGYSAANRDGVASAEGCVTAGSHRTLRLIAAQSRQARRLACAYQTHLFLECLSDHRRW